MSSASGVVACRSHLDAALRRGSWRGVLVPLLLVGLACVESREPRTVPDTPPAPAQTQAGSAPRPNVLIIFTDDQRADMLEVMHQTRRWFEDQGTSFTQAFATTPLCCPSRASIFTGRYTHNHRVLDNFSASHLNNRSTLQRYLGPAGYQTAIAGKFLNGWGIIDDPPYFDRWAVFDENASYVDVPFNVNGRLVVARGYSTAFIRKQALRFVREFERQDNQPWLLYVTPFAPHTPFTPAPEDKAASVPGWAGSPAVAERDLSDKPYFLRRQLSIEQARNIRRQQLRSLLSVDDLVGRLMQQLKTLDELEHTLAIFLSDNGFLFGEHGQVDKRLPYTASTQIPLLVRWSGHTAPGTKDDRLVANIDVMPTALVAAGVRPAQRYPIDGLDLMSPSARSRLLLEYFVDPVLPVPDWASIRTATDQYVEYYDGNGATIFREYYDLVADPWQLQNLLAEGSIRGPLRERVRWLVERLDRDRRCEGSNGPSACP